MQKRFFLAPAAIMAFILFFTVFGDRGLLMISRLHRDRDEMQTKLTELKGENEKLKREIAALQTDRRYLESIARRDFGLVRSNETIYQFPASEPKPQGAAHAVQPAPLKPEQQQGSAAPAKPEQKPAPQGAKPAAKVEAKPAAKGAKVAAKAEAKPAGRDEEKKAPAARH